MHSLWIHLFFFVTFISCRPLDKSPEEDRIQIDLFSQLLSTHWQFDHLDTIMSQSHKQIADHIQNHIDIDIQPQTSQHVFKSPTPAFDHMEYDLLKSQMMNAIQARTQGLLPEMWDQVGEALGRSAMESYIQDLLRGACPSNKDWVALSCLENHAIDLSTQLDLYVQHHLTQLWTRFQTDLLPALLDSTVKELETVVDYFNNEAFFASASRIIVNAVPWSNVVDAVKLSSLEDHSLFANFVTLAKI